MAGEEEQNKDLQKFGEEEVKDRGMFDFMSKKKGNECRHDQEVKVEVEEEKKEEHHKPHGSDSSSSSSSEEGGEECDENGEKKKKKKKDKKGLKEKIMEKVSAGESKEEDKDTSTVTVEKVECTAESLSSHEGENKGFLDKIKEKLPGHSVHKNTKEETMISTAPPAVPPPPQPTVAADQPEKDPECAKEKKGILGKIMDKIPGYHKGNDEAAAQGGGGPTTHH